MLEEEGSGYRWRNLPSKGISRVPGDAVDHLIADVEAGATFDILKDNTRVAVIMPVAAFDALKAKVAFYSLNAPEDPDA